MKDKKQLEAIITVVLIVIFIFTLVRVFGRTKKNLTANENAKTVVGSFNKIQAQEKDKDTPNKRLSIWREEALKLQLKTDPFTGARISPVKTSVRQLSLNGILADDKGILAIINNEIVGVGDRVDNYIVIKIEKDKVILNDGVNNFEIRLNR
ncbi:MAG: hypothetical protein C4533_06275 [Candidatus Omnitrophota bacterium]|jgi:hypothetical protein|nr:MAG: hypothetical protein C4533_06275 [Candidatus Omnitrophota bacterium]